MTPDLLFSAGVGLLGAVIGAASSFVPQWIQIVTARRAAVERDLKVSVEDALVYAQALDLRSHQLVLLMADVASVPGSLNRLLRISQPHDLLKTLDAAYATVEALNRASVRVTLNADPATVALTRALNEAAAALIEAHMGSSRTIRERFNRLLLGRLNRSADEVEAAREGLADARTALMDHARSTLNLRPIAREKLSAR